jgi:hypothetical protein
MFAFDLSFPNYFPNNDEIPLDEKDEVSFINHPQYQIDQFPPDQDLYSPPCSSRFNELLLHEIEEKEEDESKHPSLENLTESIQDYQNLINDEKPLSEVIEPKNKPAINHLNSILKETKNTSLTRDTPESSSGKDNKFLGRKRREDKGKGVHSKYKPDNQMRKIKSYFIKYTTDNINSSLSSEHKKVLRINPKVNENLNTKYNLDLNRKKVKDIIAENPINGRYSKEGIDKNYNKVIVKEIYEKKVETKAIKILNMTYIEYLDFMRKNDIDKFKHDLIKKEIKNGETEKEAIKYVDELVDLLMDYEGWFERKTPRTPRKEKDS